LFDETEKFCQEKAIYNAIHQSIQILNDKEKAKLTKGAIPEILQQALAVSFDTNIGHDFLEDFNERFEFYHRIEERVPFDIDYLNKITKGGLPNKTLSVFLGGTGVFKTGSMCHFAATNLMDGKNVLYITLEMAEERIAERIDANLLDIPLDDMGTITKEMYDKKVARIQRKTQGKLIIKEYPTSTAGASHFRYLINELKIKKNFKPDIIYIDYINICCSSRLKMGNNVNSYTYVKAIAEELRGLAVEFNVPVVTGTQLTRSGSDSSDPTLQDTSECIYVNEKITLRDGTIKPISDVNVGDQIIANDLYKTVSLVHHKKMKDCVKITLKSGKEIIVSKAHLFPASNNGSVSRISFNQGLKEGALLSSIS
jgi:replicative DNA helicase